MVCLPTCFHRTRNATRESTRRAATMNPGSARPCNIIIEGSGQSLTDLFNSTEDFLTRSFSNIQALLIVINQCLIVYWVDFTECCGFWLGAK